MGDVMTARTPQPFLDDPVTSQMRRDPVRLRTNQTVGEALASMRRQAPEGRIIYFYVVDAEDRLAGVVPTRRLLLSPLEEPIANLMVRRVIALPVDATVLDACEFFILHRLLAFPVVDEQRHLVGVIDVDLYIKELSDDGGQDERDVHPSDDLFQLIGVHLAQARQASPLAAFRNRFPWLICNVGGGLLAALLAWLFEAELQRAVALVLFIPVVLALAESVSMQSVSLALRVLAGAPATWRTLVPRLWRELFTGLLLGGACGLLLAGAAWLWLGQPVVVMALLGGVAGGVTAAAILGLATPYMLHLLALDPHIAAGPLALALSDLLTLLLYFNLARYLLG
jgi:magnesium transporter